MDDEIKKRFAELEARIVSLEAKIAAQDKKIAALEAEDENIVDGLYRHIDLHGEYHRDLDRMVYLSFFKTHPEFGDSMDQFHAVFDKKSKPTDNPKG